VVLFSIFLELAHAKKSLQIHRTPHSWSLTKPNGIARMRAGGYLPMSGGYLTTGAYFVNLTVGIPPVNFTVLVDTGSSNTAIPSVDCMSCSNTTLYNPDLSSTGFPILCGSPTCLKCNPEDNAQGCVFGSPYCSSVRPQNCGFGISYGGGSSMLYGAYESELLCLGGSLETGGICAFTSLGMISDPIFFGNMGILGLSSDFNACNPSCVPTIVDELIASSQISENIIGMCLTGSDGGVMDMGFVDSTRYKAPFSWIPQSVDRWYNMHILDVQVGGHSLNLPSFIYWTTNDVIGSFIDSGTSVILMGPAIQESFISVYQENYSSLPGISGNQSLLYGGCYNTSMINPSQYPTLDFLVNDENNQMVTLSVPPQVYLVLVEGSYCMGVGSAIGVGLVLGDVFLESFYVAYNRANHRIGFAPVTDCNL